MLVHSPGKGLAVWAGPIIPDDLVARVDLWPGFDDGLVLLVFRLFKDLKIRRRLGDVVQLSDVPKPNDAHSQRIKY